MKRNPLLALMALTTCILSVFGIVSCRFHHAPATRWQMQYQRDMMEAIRQWSDNPAIVSTPALKTRMNYIREHLYFSEIQTVETDSIQQLIIPFDEEFDSLCTEQQLCANVLVLWYQKGIPITKSGIVSVTPFRESFTNSATGLVGRLLTNSMTDYTGSITFIHIDGTVEYEKHFDGGILISQSPGTNDTLSTARKK